MTLAVTYYSVDKKLAQEFQSIAQKRGVSADTLSPPNRVNVAWHRDHPRVSSTRKEISKNEIVKIIFFLGSAATRDF